MFRQLYHLPDGTFLIVYLSDMRPVARAAFATEEAARAAYQGPWICAGAEAPVRLKYHWSGDEHFIPGGNHATPEDAAEMPAPAGEYEIERSDGTRYALTEATFAAAHALLKDGTLPARLHWRGQPLATIGADGGGVTHEMSLSVEQAATALGVQPVTVRKYLTEARFPRARQWPEGGTNPWRIPEGDVLNFAKPRVGRPRG